MRMRHSAFAMIRILVNGILLGVSLGAADLAAARAENVPLASSLQLESVMLVGGWASAGPFHGKTKKTFRRSGHALEHFVGRPHQWWVVQPNLHKFAPIVCASI